jgi:hypothetical protein
MRLNSALHEAEWFTPFIGRVPRKARPGMRSARGAQQRLVSLGLALRLGQRQARTAPHRTATFLPVHVDVHIGHVPEDLAATSISGGNLHIASYRPRHGYSSGAAIREGLARLVQDAGHDVVAKAPDATTLLPLSGRRVPMWPLWTVACRQTVP